MNHFAFQPNGFAACEEIRGSVSVSDRNQPVVCPKPRRIGLLNPNFNDHLLVTSLRWHVNHHVEFSESKAETDILDIILTKDDCGVEQEGSQFGSSNPFFCGTPPSRVSNPLTQDARFSDDDISLTQLYPLSPIHPPLSPASSSARKVGGCVRGNFRNSPAVRIEGFDCLDRDRRNCSIPALA